MVTQELAIALSDRTRTTGSRAESLLIAGTKRFLRTEGDHLSKAVAHELLALVKGRLGEGVGDALGEFVRELRESYDERLEARLTTAADATVIATGAPPPRDRLPRGGPKPL